jgi:hypothetical protein
LLIRRSLQNAQHEIAHPQQGFAMNMKSVLAALAICCAAAAGTQNAQAAHIVGPSFPGSDHHGGVHGGPGMHGGPGWHGGGYGGGWRGGYGHSNFGISVGVGPAYYGGGYYAPTYAGVCVDGYGRQFPCGGGPAYYSGGYYGGPTVAIGYSGGYRGGYYRDGYRGGYYRGGYQGGGRWQGRDGGQGRGERGPVHGRDINGAGNWHR